MSTLAEIQAALPQLSLEELAALERSIRVVERSRDPVPRKSLMDIKPVDLGPMRNPITADDDIFGEMIDAKRS
jgi:hypothetical protein